MNNKFTVNNINLVSIFESRTGQRLYSTLVKQ